VTFVNIDENTELKTKQLYRLAGISALVAMAAMIPEFLALYAAHRRANGHAASLAMVVTFIGLIFGGIAAVVISFIMLRGGKFGKVNAWTGIVGFTFLSLFTILSTFVPCLYYVSFYVFGMTGGLLALAWFTMTAIQFFRLARMTRKEVKIKTTC
jgi:hypothetical protein